MSVPSGTFEYHTAEISAISGVNFGVVSTVSKSYSSDTTIPAGYIAGMVFMDVG